ncbi:MAG: tyrosine decarboxylase MfnA, partial [Candidatus Bathyarchaeota archaeon]|nr:tyrosine decarboxylase MfnA [Candidatus Bathyarchaeota archaeon]
MPKANIPIKNTPTISNAGREDMEDEGLPRESVLKDLDSRLAADFSFTSGRILGSMCTSPHPLAKEVYTRFLEKNLGDPGLFPATAQLEREAVQMLGKLLSNPKASGHILTGGTEANILALLAAKKLSNKNRCEVIVPSSAHHSFDKAADLLGLKIIRIGLNSRFQVDTEAVERAINRNTAAIVAIAGTTGLGVVDPFPELSEIAMAENLPLHVDAAFGGFVLPFLRELAPVTPKFDFAVEGVSSITVDPHKMGLAAIPAGGLLFRSEELRKAVAWKVSYLAGGKTEQATLVGTRSGASVIAVWALLKHLGREGYTRVVSRCMELTRRLANGIQQIEGLEVVTNPITNIVGIKSDMLDIR